MGEEFTVARTVDLKGQVCPYTFVRSKLVLEEMDIGQVLRVIVDHEPAVNNVPRSMENEGQSIVNVGKINDDDWEIVIRKETE